MTGFGLETYGDSFSDVYDQWYENVTDADATAQFVARRTERGPVLEAGVGTGRLANPLLALGLAVIGIDTSHKMLSSWTTPSSSTRPHPIQADMCNLPFAAAGQAGGGAFGGALCAFNTLFNLPTAELQERFFYQVSRCLGARSPLIIEAMTGKDLTSSPASSVGISRLEVDRLVLSATVVDAAEQTITGQHVDITENGIKLRPWLLRWTTPQQMDAMATKAGLVLHERYANWNQDPFTESSEQHISVYLPTTQDPAAN